MRRGRRWGNRIGRTARGFGRASTALGWLIALIYVTHALILVRLPRTDRAAPLRAGWMLHGYLHSALGFCVTLLVLVALLAGAWSLLGNGRGLLSLFPPGFGAPICGAALISIYALSSFKGPGPGQRAVAIVLVSARRCRIRPIRASSESRGRPEWGR